MDPIDGRALVEELRHRGLARIPFPASRSAAALDDARAFFALPRGAKERLAIERSPHHRGFSEMRSERDWREQIHFGRELPPAGAEPAYRRLEGPNLWPDDAAWRDRVLALVDDLERAGREALGAIAVSIGLASPLAADEGPYLLLKLIRYLPAPGGALRRNGAPRSGVAPHADFSWITLVIADGEELEVRDRGGVWRAVAPEPGTLVLHAGELLETATGGAVRATAHRVRLGAGGRGRLSMPFFLCPGLDAVVPARPVEPDPHDARDHVHRVLPRGAAGSFVFGEAEWRRKGLGVWCAACVEPSW